MIPFIDLKRQYSLLGPGIEPLIKKVIADGDFILGHDVKLFEENFAQYCQTKYAVGLACGTDAILLALKALGIAPGDEVIIPVNTFIATALPVIILGAKPIFVDIDTNTYNIDVDKIEERITKKTKAIIPVHLYGLIAEMEKIMSLAKKYKLYVVEDACQAHGSEYKGKRAGSFGDIACFSFYPGKNLGAYGDAGAITTNNKNLSDDIRILRNVGQKEKYHHIELGYNSRLDTIQAVVLRAKLSHLDKWNKKRIQHAALYKKLLSGLDIVLPHESDENLSNYHLYVIRVKNRDKLLSYLKNQGINCGIHYLIPLHLQPCMKSLGYKKGDFPIAEQYAKEIISLPMFPELTDREIKLITNHIKKFYGN